MTYLFPKQSRDPFVKGTKYLFMRGSMSPIPESSFKGRKMSYGGMHADAERA